MTFKIYFRDGALDRVWMGADTGLGLRRVQYERTARVARNALFINRSLAVVGVVTNNSAPSQRGSALPARLLLVTTPTTAQNYLYF